MDELFCNDFRMSMFGYAIYKIMNGITELTGLKEEILNN